MGSEQGCGLAMNSQKYPQVWTEAEALGSNLVCVMQGICCAVPTAILRMQQETGTKTSISLFQWQETTTSKQSKLKSNGNTGSCQALGRLEPALSHSYKNTVLQQHLRNTDPGIAQNPCPQGAGQPTPPPSSPNISRLGIAQQLSSQVHGGARQGGGQCVSQLPVQKL